MALLKPLVCGKILDSGEKAYSSQTSEGYCRITIQCDLPPCDEWNGSVLDAIEKINNKEDRMLFIGFMVHGSVVSLGAKIENDVELIESYLNRLDEFFTEDS